MSTRRDPPVDFEEESFVEFSKGSVASQNYKILLRMDRIDNRVGALWEIVQEIRAAQYMPMSMVSSLATKADIDALKARLSPIERFFWGVMWSTLGSVGLIVLGLALKAGSGWKW